MRDSSYINWPVRCTNVFSRRRSGDASDRFRKERAMIAVNQR
jgi:hypothetical protein